MKTSLEIKAFKNELRNYRFYEKRVKLCQEQLDWCWSQLGGSAKSPQFDAIPGEHNNHKNDVQLDREYRIREEIEKWEDKIMRTKVKLDDINSVLDRIEHDNENGEFLRDITFKLYAKGKQSRAIARECGYCKTQILRMINKAIEKALD